MVTIQPQPPEAAINTQLLAVGSSVEGTLVDKEAG
jgi:hypothetical protein